MGDEILAALAEAAFVALAGEEVGARNQIPIEIGIVRLYGLEELLEIAVSGFEIGFPFSDLLRYFRHPS